MHSASHVEKHRNISRTWQKLTLSLFVSRKTHITKLRLRRGSWTLCLYQFLSRQIWSRNPFFSTTPIVIISPRCFRRISNSKQSSDEIEFFWSRDCNQDTTVCFSRTTQSKTQPSGEASKNVDDCILPEAQHLSTQFQQMQKNQLIDLQEHFERYCNVLPVFGFNSAKYDCSLIKSYLLPILVRERNFELTVIKKDNQFVSFKFGEVKLLDILTFLGGATSLDSFLKAHKTQERRFLSRRMLWLSREKEQ